MVSKHCRRFIILGRKRAVQCFGFHLAKLDIRQNSAFHDKAISQILKASGETDYDFENWEEKKSKLPEPSLEQQCFFITDVTISYGPKQIMF